MSIVSKREQLLPTFDAAGEFAFIINETPEGRFIAWSENQAFDWLPRMCYFLHNSSKWSPQETYFGTMQNGFWLVRGKTWRRTDFEGPCATDDDGVNFEFKAFRQLSTREIYLLATGKLNVKELPDI